MSPLLYGITYPSFGPPAHYHQLRTSLLFTCPPLPQNTELFLIYSLGHSGLQRLSDLLKFKFTQFFNGRARARRYSKNRAQTQGLPMIKCTLLPWPWRSNCWAESTVVFEVKAALPKTCPALEVEGLPANILVSGPRVCMEGLGGDVSALLPGRPVERKCHSDLWVTHFHSTEALSCRSLSAFISISLTPGAKSQIQFLLTCLIFSGSSGIPSSRTFSKLLLLKV